MPGPVLHDTSPLPTRTSRTRPVSGGRGRAHGKAILFGEHAVVHGSPAVSLPLTDLLTLASAARRGEGLRIDSTLFRGPAERAPEHLRPVVTAIDATCRALGVRDLGMEVRIRSTIPPERGLGSSAAVAAAVAGAVADLQSRVLDGATRHAIIQEAERVAHVSPSGLDAATVVADDALIFRDGIVHDLTLGAPLTLLIADSGIPGSTGEAVSGVAALRGRRRRHVDGILGTIADGVERAITALARGDNAAVGVEMTAAHEELARLGVSTSRLDSLCAAAVRAGASGAKLTGGGLGGCVLALAPSEEDAADIAASLRDAGATRVWTTTEGAR